MMSFLKRYALYLLRWQLSTPILAVCLVYFNPLGNMWSTIIANFIGGLLFFWVDKFIFSNVCFGNFWEVQEKVTCVDCGAVDRGYRLVCTASGKYDKRTDPKPEFRCQSCSDKKSAQLKAEGKL